MYIDDSAAPPPSFLNNFGDIGTTAATFLDLENEAGTPPSSLPGFEDLSTTPRKISNHQHPPTHFLEPDLLLKDVVHAKPGLSTGGRFLEFAVNQIPEQMIPDWVKSDVLKENLQNDTINPVHNLEMANPQCNPFPFCDENGCEQWQLMTLIVFQLLLLMLIAISNITIISVIFDMNKSSRNRRKGFDFIENL